MSASSRVCFSASSGRIRLPLCVASLRLLRPGAHGNHPRVRRVAFSRRFRIECSTDCLRKPLVRRGFSSWWTAVLPGECVIPERRKRGITQLVFGLRKRSIWKQETSMVRKMVPGVGLEPTRPNGRGILSPLRLPISPSGPTTFGQTIRWPFERQGAGDLGSDRITQIRC